ncbi:MAG: hypothetical protein ACRC92_18295 [Peptostreptococcaceae bacterium]
MIMKCTSRNVRKTRMKLTIGSSFNETKMPGKIRFPGLKINVFKYTLYKEFKASMKATSGQKFKSIKLKCTSLNTNAHKKVSEYNILNNVISRDILTFRDTALIFIKLHNSKNKSKFIDVKNDSAYLVLKYNEKKITSLDKFRSMKIEEVITNELFFSLVSL